jgi:Integrase zinc binding domain
MKSEQKQSWGRHWACIRPWCNACTQQTDDGFLRHDGQIYVPEAESLQFQVLQYKHDHVLSGHFSQNKTLALICREYTWPGLQSFIIEFCKSCTT